MTPSFIDLPKPSHVRYGVIVRVKQENDCDGMCMFPGCPGFDYREDFDGDVVGDPRDIFQCKCCGLWFCDEHFGDGDYCQSCAALPFGIQEQIIKFREEINR